MKAISKVVVAVVTLSSQVALADGFRCVNEDRDLKVTVYNQTDADLGTRSGAVMVVSNPQIGEGRKTIARFSDANGVLESEGATYTADVDLRFSDSSRQGELIGGTKLGELESIKLVVAHNYLDPVEDGELLDGYVRLVKRSGGSIYHQMTCTRYLKN